MNTDVTDLDATVSIVQSLAVSRQGSYICLSNVHMCMEVLDSLNFRSMVNGADMVVPDGRPIFWAQKLLGASEATQVRGQEIMYTLCKISGEKRLNIGLYGGSSDIVLEKVVKALKKSCPGIRLSYVYAPPFRALTVDEDKSVVRTINDAEVNILFVGLGCPKQERWMAAHKGRLSCVMIGVGAAFDFIAGSKRQAPLWMQKLGLEWLFRLLSEPRRLWKRYLKQNPRFIYHFACQWLFGKKYL
ncbi:WecB/TagA/CpsF family glycosyltransferase [Microbulbifer taiwanensis]